MPDFETFRRHEPVPALESPNPIIGVAGEVLHLNQAAVRALRTPHHLNLLFDREERIIGLQLADRHDPDVFEVDYPEDVGAQIAAVEFLTRYSIGPGTFRASMDANVLCARVEEDNA